METRNEEAASRFTADATTAVVRYLVSDLDRAQGFYVGRLGFQLVQRSGPVAILSRGELNLILSGPESSGARPLPDGGRQGPGGSNRIVLYLDDLDAALVPLRNLDTPLRGQIESGPGGRQIQIEDLDGNPIELHEAPKE